jgi:hypothetical protein
MHPALPFAENTSEFPPPELQSDFQCLHFCKQSTPIRQRREGAPHPYRDFLYKRLTPMVCFGIYQTFVIDSLSTPESVVLLSFETRLDSFSSNEKPKLSKPNQKTAEELPPRVVLGSTR